MQAAFKYPVSAENFQRTYQWFYNDLKFIRNTDIDSLLLAAIKECVLLGEVKFDQPFGGWIPKSTEFGIAPLRPKNLNRPNVRWIWTDGATSSINWSAADAFIPQVSLSDDEIVLVFGYFNNSAVQNTKEIQISPGNVTLPVWNVEPMRIKNEQYVLFPMPLIIEPRSPLRIDAATISVAGTTTEESGLLGYFFAPMSKLISRTG